MLLQYLLLYAKWNRTRRRSKFGDHGTICKSGRWRRGFPTIRENAFPLRRYFRSGSDHLRLAHLVGVNAHRSALNGLSRGEGILRDRHNGTAIYIVNVGDVDVRYIDVCNPSVSNVHLA